MKSVSRLSSWKLLAPVGAFACTMLVACGDDGSDVFLTRSDTESSDVSSSSAQSSSSSDRYSSSVRSSSSVTPQSSSSETSVSSSSEGGDAVPAIAMAPSFRVIAVAREIQVSGARTGAAFALFDMQGRVLSSGRVGKANFSVPVSRAGSYLVRIGHEIQRVSVR